MRSLWHFSFRFLVPLATVALALALFTLPVWLVFILASLAVLLPALVIIQQERRKNDELLQRTSEFTQNLIDVIPEPVYVKDAESRYVMVNAAFAMERGVSRAALIGTSSMDLAPDETIRAKVIEEDRRVLNGQSLTIENHNTSRNGEERYQLAMKGSCLNAQGQRVIVGANFDLTPWRLTERYLAQALDHQTEQHRRAVEFVQQLIDLIPDPVYLKDEESRFLMVNEALARERGRKKEDLIGLSSFDLAPDPETAQLSRDEDRAVIAGAEITKEQRARAPLSGEECYRVVIKRHCTDLNGQPVVFGLHHYITRWKVAELEYRHLSQQDPLTGIANRRFFTEEARQALQEAHSAQTPLTLAMLDLDHFKRVNDKYGHPVGDEVLSEIVRRGLLCLRRSDLMGRWGGEEFIILLPETDLTQACQIAERLRASIAQKPVITSQAELAITISCGVAQLKDNDDLETLILRADRALYLAKGKGRNRVIRNQEEIASQ